MFRLSQLGAYAMFPIRLLHEGVHLAAALPWAEEWQLKVAADRLTTRIVFRASTPTWAVYLTHLAPTITGCFAAVLAVLAVAGGLLEVTVATLLDVLWLAVVTWAWWAYSWPSPRDRHPQRTVDQDAAQNAPVGGDD
jgi:type IV secretory pathway VirB2 component (pilin)